MAKILNIEIAETALDDLLYNMEKGVVYTPNIDHLVKLQIDRDFFDAYRQAEWIICDSRIICRLSHMFGESIPVAIPGCDFFHTFCNYHRNDPSCRIFLLGSANGVAMEASRKINERVEREMVVGAFSPSFNFGQDEEESKDIINRINVSGATVLVVGCGAPKSEIWIARYRGLMPRIKIFMSLGATIDFEAGIKKRAPKIWQRLGFEWLYRFMHEPKRLFKRYFVEDVKFFRYYAKQLLGTYKSPF